MPRALATAAPGPERGEAVALRLSAAELQALVAATSDVVLVLDRAGRYLRVVFESNMRVKVEATGLYAYPDVSIACEEQRFVILGDQGINEKAPAGFWDDIAARLTVRFKAGEFTDGIVDAIHSAGEELKAFFPRRHGDVNELTNDISIEHH